VRRHTKSIILLIIFVGVTKSYVNIFFYPPSNYFVLFINLGNLGK